MHLVEGRNTRFLTQAQAESSFPGLRSDYDRLSIALAITELFACFSQAGDVSEEAFDLLESSLRAIESHQRPLVASVWTQVALLELEGLQPSWTVCPVTGTTLTESPAWVSPTAGGYLSNEAANGYPDRYLTRAEVLLGLDKLTALKEPPRALRFAEETHRALTPFWKQQAHASLPANDSLLSLLDHGLGSE